MSSALLSQVLLVSQTSSTLAPTCGPSPEVRSGLARPGITSKVQAHHSCLGLPRQLSFKRQRFCHGHTLGHAAVERTYIYNILLKIPGRGRLFISSLGTRTSARMDGAHTHTHTLQRHAHATPRKTFKLVQAPATNPRGRQLPAASITMVMASGLGGLCRGRRPLHCRSIPPVLYCVSPTVNVPSWFPKAKLQGI